MPLGAAVAVAVTLTALALAHRTMRPAVLWTALHSARGASRSYDLSLCLCGCAAALELAAEPAFLASQQAGRLWLRLLAEAAATSARSAALLGLLLTAGNGLRLSRAAPPPKPMVVVLQPPACFSD